MLGSDSAAVARSYKSLAHLLNAGIGLTEALNVLSPSAVPEDRRKIMRLRARISRGMSVAATLRLMKFPNLDVALVDLGEETGSLAHSCQFLGEQYEQRAQIERSIEAASLLPLLLVIGSILLKRVPPLVNQQISGEQYLFRTFSALCVFTLIAAGSYLLMKHPDRYPRASRFLTSVTRHIPKLRGFIKTLARYRFFSGLYICVRAGCEIKRTFTLAGAMTNDPQLRRASVQIPTFIVHDGLAGALQRSGVFETEELSQILVGEESGRLEECLKQITDDYFSQLGNSIAHFREWAPRVFYVICLLYIL